MNIKAEIITQLYITCKKQNNMVFHNNLVKDICKKVGFGNPFDVTKLDNKAKLPPPKWKMTLPLST